MSDTMELVQNEDGTFSAYDDTYDIVIHCETEEEQKKVIEQIEQRIANFDCKSCRYGNAECEVCDKDCSDALIDDLLDIVKGGGIE